MIPFWKKTGKDGKKKRWQHHRHHAEGGGSVAAGVPENKKQRLSLECRCAETKQLPFRQVECDLRFYFRQVTGNGNIRSQ